MAVIGLKGRVSVDEEDALRDAVNALVNEGRLKLVLNLRGVTLIDSAGLGTIVAHCVRVRRRGGDLKLVQGTLRTAHALHITGLDTVFESFESEDEAVRSFL